MQFSLCISDMGYRYPVSDLSCDVQRSISDQRSLRHGACSEQQQKTGASWRQARVRGLRQEVHTEKELKTSPVLCTPRWWCKKIWVRALFKGLHAKMSSQDSYYYCACNDWCLKISLWHLFQEIHCKEQPEKAHGDISLALKRYILVHRARRACWLEHVSIFGLM